MSRSRIAGRYAKALYRIDAADQEKTAKHYGFLNELGNLFQEPGIKKILVSPVMPNDLKFDIMSYALDKMGADTDIRTFVKAVVDSGRVAVFESIAAEYKSIIQERNNITEAVVTVAASIPQTQIDEIASIIGPKIGRKLILTQKVDKSILGGFLINFGNSLIDLTLKTRLNAMAANAVK